MPEGLCARCGEGFPVLYTTFLTRDEFSPLATDLGFCSSDCRTAFCAAIKELQRAV